ncbi:MAG: hypothetical protein KA998_05330 [Rickettsiaceae bacterium]|nr:hypothetical protein [Rickettsiaceae bacterium]
MGVTPLHLAAEKDTTGEFVSELIRLGADARHRDKYKLTPIHYAINNKKPQDSSANYAKSKTNQRRITSPCRS